MIKVISTLKCKISTTFHYACKFSCYHMYAQQRMQQINFYIWGHLGKERNCLCGRTEYQEDLWKRYKDDFVAIHSTRNIFKQYKSTHFCFFITESAFILKYYHLSI